MSLRGYWRTDSVRIACRPAIRITRLTTTARTGRRTKRSVNFMGVLPGPLAVFRLRRRVVGRLRRVVDLDRGARTKLENSGGHDLLAGLQALENGHLVAAPRAELHELLPNALVLRAVGALHRLDDVHRVAVRRVVDRRGGNRDDRRRGAEAHRGRDEHARLELRFRVREGGLD